MLSRAWAGTGGRHYNSVAAGEGERADDGRREPRLLANHAERVAEILEHRKVKRRIPAKCFLEATAAATNAAS